MSQALYRKYRSRSLGEIVGQGHVTDVLSGAFADGRISHAYLLTGPRGVGKTSVARIIAHEINKLPYSDDPHLDIIEIDAASNRRIDDIRDLREKIHIAPVSAGYKVYIIDEVHMLTGESFNALLKTLEEPPAHAVFILATTELHKVPATIISRTQRFHFRPVEVATVAAHLKAIAAKENIKIDDAALELIAKHGGGSFRDSISLLDQLSHSSQKVTREHVESTLGLVPEERIAALVDAIVKRQLASVLEQLKAATDGGISYVTLTEQLIIALSIEAPHKPELYTLINNLLDVPKSHSPELKLLATLASFAKPAVSKSLATPTVSIQKELKPAAPAVPRRPAKDDKPPVTEHDSAKEAAAPAPRQSGGKFDWNLVLERAQTYNAPLFSVIKRAEINYENDVLTMSFIYAIHRKKLENTKYRSELVKIITDACGSCPQIALHDAKSQPIAPDAAAVAAIMGGGDSVHASI